MKHGGKREGAGRKAGALNQRTREIAEAAAQEGVTPLEVMLQAMRHHYDRARAEMDKAEGQDPELIREALNAASGFAKDAAPTCIQSYRASTSATGKANPS